MAIVSNPLQLAREIALFFGSLSPTSQDIRAAAEEVQKRQLVLRRGKAGNECVVESLMRCALTHRLQSQLGITHFDLPARVNSSHVSARGVCISKRAHDHLIEDRVWEGSWTAFQADHPEVNVFVPGRKNPRRADMYVAAAGEIVSIEFKYLKPGRCGDLKACIAQMNLYIGSHAATVFVVYTARPEAGESARWLKKLQAGFASKRGLAVAVSGPPIPVF